MSLGLPKWLSTWYGKTTKFLSIGGATLYIFFNKFASELYTENPEATIGEAIGGFYANAYNAAVEHFIPGSQFILSEIFRITADTIVPGIGSAISAVFNVAATTDTISPYGESPIFNM